MQTRRTAVLIHLDRLRRNIERIQKLTGSVPIMPVLKGNAYGHGIENVYPVFKACGISAYAVAVWEEGRRLRALGETGPILLLGDTADGEQQMVIQYGLTQTVFNAQTAAALNEKAKEAGVMQPVHLKIDTGMSRIGLPAGEAALKEAKKIAALSNIKITGAFSHFMCAEDLEDPRTEQQFKKFTDTIALLRANGIEIPMLHIANSASTLYRPHTYLDCVRPGDIFYGVHPHGAEGLKNSDFEEVMTWESVVAMVKKVPAGTEVGYGATYTCCEETRIATIPVGFADGYSRKLSNKGFVYINGQQAPIIGRVCMDQFMVDVTDIEGCERGTRVELLGDHFGYQEMAELLDENQDETLLRISDRPPRICVGE